MTGFGVVTRRHVFNYGAVYATPVIPSPIIVIPPGNDFIDYIFQFPDQASFFRDPTIVQLKSQGAFTAAVALLIYNPVEATQGSIPSVGNVLVFPPQLAQSSVALPGYWGMITIKGGIIPQLLTHPNIQVVNDRTLMFARSPSVVFTKIDVSHINIIINSFGVYVRDGLSQIFELLLEDGISQLLLESNDLLQLEPKSATSTYVGPGDALSSGLFTAFWGFRAFSQASIGRNVVQLRRSSDSVTRNFSALANGMLDAGAIATFAQGANLTVATMYDQTGNGHDMVPTNSSFEQSFLPNTLNGMGVYANPNRNATAYRTNTTFTILNTWSNCFYSVFKVAATAPGLFQNICAVGDDEIGLVADRDANFDSVTMKNEAGNGFGGLDLSPPPPPGAVGVPEKEWHVGVGVLDQNIGSTDSFLMVDRQSHINSGALVGNPNVGLATVCMWGEDGLGPNTNVLQGYAAETAWFATPTPNQPWTQAQAVTLINNAKTFWGLNI